MVKGTAGQGALPPRSAVLLIQTTPAGEIRRVFSFDVFLQRGGVGSGAKRCGL
ncbi:MAG: hypothetical protein GYB24_07030 [Rhodobacteraceae bacterium]|nr:hypothetical protein [Paracoccaceae bacterium]